MVLVVLASEIRGLESIIIKDEGKLERVFDKINCINRGLEW